MEHRREFLTNSVKLTAVGTITSIAGCLGSSKPDSVSVDINGWGSWSGSIGGDGGSRSVQGRSRDSYSFQEVPDVVSATIQKRERGGSELVVSIVADGENVKRSSTTAEFGVVSVSHSFM